jgi:hypothetical protein
VSLRGEIAIKEKKILCYVFRRMTDKTLCNDSSSAIGALSHVSTEDDKLSRLILEQLIVPHLVKKFPLYMEPAFAPCPEVLKVIFYFYLFIYNLNQQSEFTFYKLML